MNTPTDADISAGSGDTDIDEPTESRVEKARRESAAGGDERLAYRGVFARMLVRPEIGAVIAAIAIWAFFWAVSVPFGLAGGTASILDVSSTLGIMAVAVAMLMIGGEFDLSSGAATGALGIVTILIVRDVTGELGGAGLSLWLALPISLAIALGLGWFNGTVVNRTGLPSFIVTLASFFILRGAKLGFSKLLVGQIQVGKMNDLDPAIGAGAEGRGDRGYAFFNRLFAAEWERNLHTWEARDLLYTACAVGGLSLVAIAVYELRFARKAKMSPVGLVVFVAGIVGAVAGILTLHNTDGTSGDALGAAIIGASMLAGFLGLAAWRYEPLADKGSLGLSGDAFKPLIVGIAALAAAVVAAISFDADNSEDIFFLVTEQGLRAILFVSLSMAGAVLLLLAANRAGAASQFSRSSILLLTAAGLAGMAFFVRSQSASPKFRTEAFSVMLVIAAILAVWAVVTLLFKERRFIDEDADKLGNRLMIIGALLFVAGITIRLLFSIQAELDAGIPPAKFSVRTLWFLGFAGLCTWVLARTKFGSWTFAVGGNSEYIIAAVVGGTALTGGYGSTIGAAIGAVIMAMSVQGIPSSRWNSDWRFVFLGAILLLAVIANNSIRAKAEASR